MKRIAILMGIWLLALIDSLIFSIVDVKIHCKDLIISLVLLFVMVLLTLLYIKQYKRDYINISLPYLYLMFFVISNYVSFGYGNTLGILGYNKKIGLLSIINISRNLAFVLLCFTYLLIGIIFSFNYIFLKAKYRLNVTIYKLLSITMISSTIIFVMESVYKYCVFGRLSNAFAISVAIHMLIFIIVSIFNRNSNN